MKYFWRTGQRLLEVAKPEVDDAGYDLILQADGVIRHVQLKSSYQGSSLRQIELPVTLGNHLGACAIVIRFDVKTLALGPFHFFGGQPGESLPELTAFRIALHKRRDRFAQRKERPAIRCVQLTKLTPIATIDLLARKLFGSKHAA